MKPNASAWRRVRTWRDDAREHAREILQAALHAAHPRVVMRRVLRDREGLLLPDGSRVRLADRAVRVVAIGKAAGAMGAHARSWGPFEEAVVSAPHHAEIPSFEAHVGGHPIPDEASLRAGERALDLARATGPDDLLIVLLSGGASAMAEAPRVPLADLQRATKLLLASGAPIEEVNAVRVALSRLKGGGLARACRGEILTLAVSDVDEEATLGAGPTIQEGGAGARWDPGDSQVRPRWEPGGSQVGIAEAALRRHGLWESMPRSIREAATAAAQPPDALETVSGPRLVGAPPDSHLRATWAPPGSHLAPRHLLVLADNDTALHAAARAAARLGYEPELRSRWLRGEARERGRELGALARELHARPTALLVGGETTVRVVGHGKGGRNQEVALAAVDALSGRDALLATLGTDGVDGPTDAAGAIVDGFTRARADAVGLDAQASLAENDAYAYFDRLDDLVRTGPTGTNVRDLAVVLLR